MDAVGNPGPWSTEPFAILAAPGAPPATTAVSALPSSNWRKLTPRRGAKIRSTRPTLRWAAGPRGTRLYNVQIFLVGKDNALKKVRTAFPQEALLHAPPARRPQEGLLLRLAGVALPRLQLHLDPPRGEPLLHP